MKPEEKDLLLQDLCARLPYRVKAKANDIPVVTINGIVKRQSLTGYFDYDVITNNSNFYLKEIKPYLRPMSSMTEEEKKEYIEYAGYEIEESVNGRHYEYYLKDFCGTPDNPSVNTNGVDWLNKKMFDFRGLIPASLALSTDVFNPYKD